MRTESDARLRCWLRALLETPGLTAIKDWDTAWREHVVESLRAAPLIERFSGPIADVGSGGGAPGIPLAAAFPDREVTLIESQARKCRFLHQFLDQFSNLRVICGRAEEQAVDSYGVVVAKALAAPAVALEWCLPLAAPGGAAILFTGLLEHDLTPVARVLAGAAPELYPVSETKGRLLVVVRKTGTTPPGYPRKTGIAKKRPLG